MANYSQAQKQQYRLTLKNKRKHIKGAIGANYRQALKLKTK
jgi:hypothetical protein